MDGFHVSNSTTTQYRSLADGSLIWQVSGVNNAAMSNISLDGYFLYRSATNDLEVTLVDPTGTQLWTKTFPDEWSSLQMWLDEDAGYVSTLGGDLVKLDYDGNTITQSVMPNGGIKNLATHPEADTLLGTTSIDPRTRLSIDKSNLAFTEYTTYVDILLHVVDKHGGHYTQDRPTDRFRKVDGNNSVWDYPYTIRIFGPRDTDQGLQVSDPPDLKTLDYTTGAVVDTQTPPFGIHATLWVGDHILGFLADDRHRIVSLNPDTYEIEWDVDLESDLAWASFPRHNTTHGQASGPDLTMDPPFAVSKNQTSITWSWTPIE